MKTVGTITMVTVKARVKPLFASIDHLLFLTCNVILSLSLKYLQHADKNI